MLLYFSDYIRIFFTEFEIDEDFTILLYFLTLEFYALGEKLVLGLIGNLRLLLIFLDKSRAWQFFRIKDL